MEELKILDKLSHIQTNVTTADEVRVILGRPDYVFPHERIWIYQDPAAHFVGPTLPYCYSDYIAEVVFDENQIVERIATASRDVLSKGYGFSSDVCLPSGICELDGRYRMVLAPPDADGKAKEFLSDRDHCIVYVYGEYIYSFQGDVFGISNERYYLSDIGYSLARLSPGRYEIKSAFGDYYKYPMNCVAGAVVFLHQRMTRDVPIPIFHKRDSPIMEQVPENVGREAVEKRKLIANPNLAVPVFQQRGYTGYVPLNRPNPGSYRRDRYIDP